VGTAVLAALTNDGGCPHKEQVAVKSVLFVRLVGIGQSNRNEFFCLRLLYRMSHMLIMTQWASYLAPTKNSGLGSGPER